MIKIILDTIMINPVIKCTHPTNHLFEKPLCKEQTLLKRIANIAFHILTLGIPYALYHLSVWCFSKGNPSNEKLEPQTTQSSSVRQSTPPKTDEIQEDWEKFLQDSCDVYTNCDLSDAQVIFLGDTHTDMAQEAIRQKLILHYAHSGQTGTNLIFLEGTDLDFPSRLKDKSFTVEVWDDKEHFEHHGELIEQFCGLLKNFNDKKKELIDLKNNKEIPLQEKKMLLIPLITEIREINSGMESLKEEGDKAKKLRDIDLIESIKCSLTNPNQKIFVIAGTKHLRDENYDIASFFEETPHAILIPKDTHSGEIATETFMQNVLDIGQYNASYYHGQEEALDSVKT
jgi:hypothetical protein